jgi:hypothetical protein
LCFLCPGSCSEASEDHGVETCYSKHVASSRPFLLEKKPRPIQLFIKAVLSQHSVLVELK